MPKPPPPRPDVAADSIVWLVSYDQEDDREMTRPQIAAAIARGEIDGDTIVWRAGLEDWVAVGDIPSLARLLPSSGDTTSVGDVAPMGFLGTGTSLKNDALEKRKSQPPPLPKAGGAGRANPIPRANAGKAPARPPTKASATATPLVGTLPRAIPKAPPTPRTPPIRSPHDDDDDDAEPLSVDPESIRPMPVAPAPKRKGVTKIGLGMPLVQRDVETPTLTAARALSAGTFGTATPEKSSTGWEEAPPSSGTPSLTSLAAVTDRPSHEIEKEILALEAAPKSLGLSAPPTIDIGDIEASAADDMPTSPLNVPPPPVAPPNLEPVERRSDTAKSRVSASPEKSKKPEPAKAAAQLAAPVLKAPEQRGGKGIWIALLAALCLAAVFLVVSRKAPAPPEETPEAEVARPAQAPAPPEPAPPAVETAAPIATAPPAEDPEPTPQKEQPAVVPPPENPRPVAHAPEAEAPRRAPPVQAAEPAPAPETPKPAEERPIAAATTTPAPAPAPSTRAAPAEASTEPFDKSAASAALSAAATEASGCRREGDPSGRAQVKVTFAPSGRAVHALVEGPPFAGTATGGCIASVMRRARVPAFAGERITVGKTVQIQ